MQRSLALLLCTAALACTDAPSRHDLTLVLDEERAPLGAGAGQPHLYTAGDGRVVLSWQEPVGQGVTALRVALRDRDGRWGEAYDVVRRSDLFVNWADFPSAVILADGRLLAHWLQRNGSARYAYEVRMAESRDGGATWSPSVTPHRAGVQAEHGFASILPDLEGGARVFFLDGGAGMAGPHGGAGSAHGVAMSLSTNAWSAAMGEATKAVLDRRICDCCQTAAAMTARGPIVVYRDRSDAEIRDIAITRLVAGEWTAPRSVHDDGWQINACPVNGPSVAAQGDDVAVAWFSGARDSAKVQVAFSRDAGATFAAPIRVDDGTPAGRVAVQWWDGAAWVSWLERGTGDTASVRVRRVAQDGGADAATTVSRSTAARASGFPRMTRTADGLLFAWTLPGSPSAVRVARLTQAAK